MSSPALAVPTPGARSRSAKVALVLALLGIPGCTVAWSLPAGGFWIGIPLAIAAIVVGVRALADEQQSRAVALTAILLAGIEIVFTATWTVVG